ncbi:glycoside hydrolase family 31 protein [Clostridium sp. AL.422]|uniref:glycoside hydrolase family 31 protein n=1 Tax=Clostridium TaxID=1485 RepID=UPI00293DADA1|nr:MULTISPECIES: glycoside hydrolase family 31 protein [unclassified Clostridium]MDV4151788.1 glycoside hydrolase family 31 protein [Clostridium sp. AL.422]
MLGRLLGHKVNSNVITLRYEKIETTISIINDKVINFFVPFYRKERKSKAIENIYYKHTDFSVEEKISSIIIKTKSLIIEINDEFKVDIYDRSGNVLCRDYRGERSPFIRRGNNLELAAEEGHNLNGHQDLKVCVAKTMEDNMYFYGLGERTGSLNKKGYHYRNWNTDDPNPHGETFEQLYKSIPFLISIKDKDAFGIFFDNHFETHLDMGKENSMYYYFGAVEGNLDYYFIYGPEVKNVVNEYTSLTGKTPLPQLWTLGYQQCRWSYAPKERALEIAQAFREKEIPCDTIYLDIDYMDGFRVFTWDNKKFDNPKKFISELKQMGFKVVTIIDPGVKIDKDYSIYSEGLKNDYFAKDKDGIVYKNKVWPGDSVYPDFMNSRVRKWWADNQRIMVDTGISGIWNDMNEPASFNGPLPADVVFNEDGVEVTHKEIHNIYGHMMSKATYEGIKENTNKRPFVITRACYAGTQKYSTIWTGDNQSTWEHLRMSIPMLMNLGLSGMSFCGTDVGGFGHDCTGELLSRWVQVGVFTPLFRNHSAMGTRDQEPWTFDKETEEINKKYIKLRYKLIPYLYDLMWKCENTGAPIIRPLLFEYQNDKNTYEINDEFLCGESILVSPVVEQGMRQKLVYLPKGDMWIDYLSGESYKGGQYIIKESPLDICPIFIRADSIIPIGIEQNYIGEKDNDELILNIYLGEDENEFRYIHYIDDGESFDYKKGIYNEYEVIVSNKEYINIRFLVNKNNYSNKYTKVKFIITNLKSNKKVILNDEEVTLNNNVVEINI